MDAVDMVDCLLDEGLVLDSFMRGSAFGLETWTVDSRMLIASFDTYSRLADETVGLTLDQ